jgi:hypothetical protein
MGFQAEPLSRSALRYCGQSAIGPLNLPAISGIFDDLDIGRGGFIGWLAVAREQGDRIIAARRCRPVDTFFSLERAFCSRKDTKTQSFSMRYFCRTDHLPGDGIIACKILFFFAFLASLRDQLPILGSGV